MVNNEFDEAERGYLLYFVVEKINSVEQAIVIASTTHSHSVIIAAAGVVEMRSTRRMFIIWPCYSKLPKWIMHNLHETGHNSDYAYDETCHSADESGCA